jgi:hypothetical protein
MHAVECLLLIRRDEIHERTHDKLLVIRIIQLEIAYHENTKIKREQQSFTE